MIANLEERKEKLSNYWSEYNSMQFELESLCDEEEDDRSSFEEMFFDLTANLRHIISEHNYVGSNHVTTAPLVAPSVSPVANSNSAYNIRLPKLDLSNFRDDTKIGFHFMKCSIQS